MPLNFDAVPAIVARILQDRPILARPRTLAERNRAQIHVINTIAERSNLPDSDILALTFRVSAAYGAQVPHPSVR